MANFTEQVFQLWSEFEEETGKYENLPDDFIDWALENGKLAPRPEDIRKQLKRRVMTAVRQKRLVDDDGVEYRAKQCVLVWDDDLQQQLPLWFDTDKGGTPSLRKKAIKQRRDAIADDVYRAVSDVVHMNKVHKEENQFVMDFSEDYLERKAAEALGGDDEAA